MVYLKSGKIISSLRDLYISNSKGRHFYRTVGEQLKLVDFKNLSSNKVNKVVLYRLVNTYYTGERARLVNRYLVDQLRRFNLLC